MHCIVYGARSARRPLTTLNLCCDGRTRGGLYSRNKSSILWTFLGVFFLPRPIKLAFIISNFCPGLSLIQSVRILTIIHIKYFWYIKSRHGEMTTERAYVRGRGVIRVIRRQVLETRYYTLCLNAQQMPQSRPSSYSNIPIFDVCGNIFMDFMPL